MRRKVSDRLTRSLKILHLLGSRSWVSAEEFSERLNVNLRTVYRDVAELQERGIPIQALRGPGGGYSLRIDHTLSQMGSLVGLDSQQALSLLFSRITTGQDREVAPREEHDAFNRLLGRCFSRGDKPNEESFNRKVLFDSTDWYWRDDGTPLFADLWEAVFTGTEMDVRHRERNTNFLHEARVRPYGLVWKAGQWYIIWLNCVTNQIERVRIERILQANLTKTRFPYPSDFDLEAWWREELIRFGAGTNKVVLEIGKEAAADFLRLGRKQTTKIQMIGNTLRMELFVDKWEWLIPLVMSYGPEVIVREPLALRDAILTRYRRAIRAFMQGRAKTEGYSRSEDNRVRPTRGGRYST